MDMTKEFQDLILEEIDRLNFETYMNFKKK